MTPTRTPGPLTRRGRGGVMTVRLRLAMVAAVALVALVGLVAVNAAQDWRQEANLRNDAVTGDLGGRASLPLFIGAQNERKLSAVYMASPTAAHKAALQHQRSATDQGVASFRRLSGTELRKDQRHEWSYVEKVYAELDGLATTRRRADAHTGDPDQVTGYYTRLVTELVQFYQALSAIDDPGLTTESRALVGLFWASDALSQEDMLISQARAAGSMTAARRTAFAEAYGTQSVMYERWIAPYLPPSEKAAYDALIRSAAWHTTDRVAQAVISAPSTTGTLWRVPAETGQWASAYAQVSQKVNAIDLARTVGLLTHLTERADQVRTQVYWQVGISLAAVVLIAVLIIGLIRSISSRIRLLQTSAEETAERLPLVVARLQEGEQVDPEAEFPHPPSRGDEFAGLERALNSAQHTALRMADAQAADRRGFAGFVAITSIRALNLVERQLDELDTLERTYGSNAALLRDLIKVDHRGVAARRHLDNLQTLAGGADQPYTEPKALADLVHDARAETAEPERVRNRIRTDVWVSPQAVNAVMHVVAALLDNALSFSATEVSVTSVSPVHGVAVEIEDMGTGMSEEQYVQANAKLSEPPTFESMAQNEDGRLGLFVVGHLAHAYGLRVSLRPSDYGGTKAVVMLPHAIFSDDPTATPGEQRQLRPAPAATAAPSGALPRREPKQRPARATAEHSRPRETLAASPAPDGHPASPPDRAEPAAHPRDGAAPARLPAREAGPAQTGTRAAADRTAAPAPAGATSTARPQGPAPELPRRRPLTHLAPQLATPVAAVPAYDPSKDVDAETVGTNWGAWQQGTRAAETSTDQEDENR
ncbi:nitrate- and nitrite sensing domain-containing protein [Streptomyces sp. NPDC059740]|uniref:nitrate- and nitrite sensing domain-containing protein n=1 Tax=Streptomyces sp. NPDC059740 TaxID=3346926 RepID=UPI0036501553